MAKATRKKSHRAADHQGVIAESSPIGGKLAAIEASDIACFTGAVTWSIYAALQISPLPTLQHTAGIEAPTPGLVELPFAVDYVARMQGLTFAEALGRTSAAVKLGLIRMMERHRWADGWDLVDVTAYWSAIDKRLRMAADGRSIEWPGGRGWGVDWMLYIEDEGLDALLAPPTGPTTPSLEPTALPPGTEAGAGAGCAGSIVDEVTNQPAEAGVWFEAAVDRLKGQRNCPAGITDAACILAKEMVAALKAGKVDRAWKPGTIKNYLRSRKLWSQRMPGR